MFAPVRNALHLIKPHLDILWTTKFMKSSHHLSHDQASKGHVSIPDLASQTDLHCRITQYLVQKGTNRCTAFRTGAKFYLSKKIFLG